MGQYAARRCRYVKWCLRVLTLQVQGPGAPEERQEPVYGAQPGQVSQQVVESMRQSITSELQAERVDISDAYGDGRHVSIDVVASAFEVSKCKLVAGYVTPARPVPYL